MGKRTAFARRQTRLLAALLTATALAHPARAEALRGALQGVAPSGIDLPAPVAPAKPGPFPDPPAPPADAASNPPMGMAGRERDPLPGTALRATSDEPAAPPVASGPPIRTAAASAAGRDKPARTPGAIAPAPVIRSVSPRPSAAHLRAASSASDGADFGADLDAGLPGLEGRAIPFGERLPDMRGPLARSLVLGELRRAGSPPPELGDIVGAIGDDSPSLPDNAGTGVADTVRSALVADDGLRASLARADAAGHGVARARGAMLPKITLEGTMGSRSPLTKWEEATYRTARAVLTVPVFASGANLASMRAARASADAAALTHLAEERVAVLEAATAHLDLHAAIAVERALAANTRGMVETLGVSRALFEAGEASLADVAVAEANLESSRGELAAGRQALERARIDYRVRTGRSAPASLRAPDTDDLVPADVERAVEAAMRGPDVEAGFRRADAARHDARAELGRAGPRIDLTASYGHSVDAIEEPDGAYDAALGVRLTVPIIDFETVPGVRQARARARASEYEARDAARDVERRVRNAHAGHAGAMAREASAGKRVEAMGRALEATRAEYHAGFRTVTDVVRARVGLARARIDLANAARDRHRAAYTVGVLVGKVSPAG